MMVLVPLASAQTESFTATADEAVWSININSPANTHGLITLYQANGDTVSGYWTYTMGIPTSTFSAKIGDSDVESYTYMVPLSVGISVWNGDNTSLARQIKLGYGQLAGVGIQQGYNRVLTTDIDRAVITGYTISADNQITVTSEIVPRTKAAGDLNSGTNDPGLVDLLKTYVPLVVSVFLSLIYWLKFLFVDHLITTVLLYMFGTLAYAVNTSKNIFVFYKTWFRQQRALFEFMAQGFSTTFQILTQVAAVVGNAVGSMINLALIAAKILLRL